jgi:hypothetical protein
MAAETRIKIINIKNPRLWRGFCFSFDYDIIFYISSKFVYMSENTLRHLVAICATLICAMAYYSGWVSSDFGWWWTIFGLLIVYGGIISILKH